MNNENIVSKLDHTVKAPILGAFIFYKNFIVTIDITTKKIIITNVTQIVTSKKNSKNM